MSIQADKVIQSKQLINQSDIDMWITIGRETVMNSDPVIPLISKLDFGSMTAVLIAKNAESICLTGHLDYEGMCQSKVYDRVTSYDLDFDQAFMETVKALNPKKIALNFSDDVSCDGITHGLFVKVKGLLNNCIEDFQLVSSEMIVKKLRSQKTSSEVDAIKSAIEVTETILLEVKNYIKPGMTEKDIHHFCQRRLKFYHAENAWDIKHNPGVMVGTDTPFGHAGPTDLVVKPGDLITLDFGAKVKDYCSDIQRVYYVLKEDEEEAPIEFQNALKNIHNAIEEGVKGMVIGNKGFEPDENARKALKASGLPDFNFAFGHQVGRETHDGGVLMGPKWPRYKGLVEGELEKNSVYTVDINIKLEKGHMGQEDMVLLTKKGVEFISTRQSAIYLCK